MPSVRNSANQVRGDNVVGVPRSGRGAGALEGYDWGTVTISNSRTYRSFNTAFTGRPAVILTPMQSAGSRVPQLAGTPNTGSFSAKVTGGAGSINCAYMAFGAR